MKTLRTLILLLIINTTFGQISNRLDDTYNNLFVIGPDSAFSMIIPKIYGGDYKFSKQYGIYAIKNETSQFHLSYVVIPDTLLSELNVKNARFCLKQMLPEGVDLSGSFGETTSPLTGMTYLTKYVSLKNGKGENVNFKCAVYFNNTYNIMGAVMASIVNDNYWYKFSIDMALNTFTWFPMPINQPEIGLAITLPECLLNSGRFTDKGIDIKHIEPLNTEITDYSKPSILFSFSEDKSSLQYAWWDVKDKSIVGMDYDAVYDSYESVAYLRRIDDVNNLYRLEIVTYSKVNENQRIRAFFTKDIKLKNPIPKKYDGGASYLLDNLAGDEAKAQYIFYYTWMQYMAATLSIHQ
ncbi:MAG: hypothetical protein H6600_03695 [Flavobacteriales bacterium]|nr:hypothetical protein [Flavobacteriales bacterium]